MTDFRDARIGSQKTALLLGVSVTELREAVLGNRLLRGVSPPPLLYLAGQRRNEMMFNAGDVMDCAEAIQQAKSTNPSDVTTPPAEPDSHA